MSFNKRASLEISIQAIVIVVLAMTILGLGLGFVRGLFKNISGTTDQVTEQVKQKILDDLVTGDKKVSFPTTEITLDKGSSTVLTVGVRNKGDASLTYSMDFNPVSGPDGSGNTAPIANPDPIKKWFQFGSTTSTLAAAESDVRNVRISVPTSAYAGSYFFTFKVTSTLSPPPYAEKDFFIVVRG